MITRGQSSCQQLSWAETGAAPEYIAQPPFRSVQKRRYRNLTTRAIVVWPQYKYTMGIRDRSATSRASAARHGSSRQPPPSEVLEMCHADIVHLSATRTAEAWMTLPHCPRILTCMRVAMCCRAARREQESLMPRLAPERLWSLHTQPLLRRRCLQRICRGYQAHRSPGRYRMD